MQRRKFIKQTGILSLITIAAGIPGCSLPFEYSPHDIKIKSEFKGLTAKNLAKIKSLDQNKSSFKFAFISDNHTFYDDFEDQIKDINSRDDIDFVIHGGDITLSSLHKEFTWFNEIIGKLRVPFLTVIGNHDHLSNGKAIYEKSFGPTNYTFTFGACKFVMFDNIIWENNNKDPEFEWFKENITNDKAYNHVIPVSHIPPWGDQFINKYDSFVDEMMVEKGIKLSIHGHTHSYHYAKRYGQIDYLVVGDTPDRNYAVVSIDEDNYNVERINF